MLSHHKETQHEVYRVRHVFCDKKDCIFRWEEEGELSNTVFSPEKYRHTLIYFSVQFGMIAVVCRSPFLSRPIHEEGGGKIEDQKEGLFERACQTARSKVLGDDAGC